ncbi:hypothetical protein HK405_011964, partial [Cladochytrium tenue]
ELENIKAKALAERTALMDRMQEAALRAKNDEARPILRPLPRVPFEAQLEAVRKELNTARTDLASEKETAASTARGRDAEAQRAAAQRRADADELTQLRARVAELAAEVVAARKLGEAEAAAARAAGEASVRREAEAAVAAAGEARAREAAARAEADQRAKSETARKEAEIAGLRESCRRLAQELADERDQQQQHMAELTADIAAVLRRRRQHHPRLPQRRHHPQHQQLQQPARSPRTAALGCISEFPQLSATTKALPRDLSPSPLRIGTHRATVDGQPSDRKHHRHHDHAQPPVAAPPSARGCEEAGKQTLASGPSPLRQSLSSVATTPGLTRQRTGAGEAILVNSLLEQRSDEGTGDGAGGDGTDEEKYGGGSGLDDDADYFSDDGDGYGDEESELEVEAEAVGAPSAALEF